MDLDLTGRHALVCGASQGLGLAAARELALLGASVSLLARRADRLAGVAATLDDRAPGQRHGWIAVDTGETAVLRAKVAALVAQAPVHVLVNNSGGPPPGALEDADEAALLAAYRQHVLAAQTLAGIVVPGMRRDGFGRIVNIVSSSVREPIPGLGVSNVTRGAMASWAKTLARELAPYGITVNNVLPGSIDTPRIAELAAARAAGRGSDAATIRQEMADAIPMRRLGRAEEVGAAVAFLAAPAAAYISGVSLAVDGGRMHAL
ncbi:SDR family oxidoreductase [Coralloluteibacterium stylophorae]|uniref:SDR family oxidoreductase n=1 Tax=Coralloluteibacterium stylophorae TaxID=1776034 RepID=A0A8J7VW12_9GAMM|nr:SDR family oxidoreductase [Coralloluteibacterium stylophorae]MBS7455956.1 SDR family oxidoreductase [Coralloluteibacterium stylophorae]